MNKEKIENFIEEMTKVRPEMLNKQALELFNTIIEILDHVEELEADNYEQNNIINSYIEERRILIDKLKEDKKELTEELKYDITKREAKIQLNLIDKYLEMLGEKK